MTRSTSTARPGRPLRRLLVLALLAGLLVTIAVACVPALRERAALALVKPSLVARLSEVTGMNVRLGSIEREEGLLALDGLELLHPGEQRPTPFRAERLVLGTTPFELLRHGTASVRSWTLIGPRLQVESGGGAKGWLGSLGQLDRLEVRDGSIRASTFEAEEVQLVLEKGRPAQLEARIRRGKQGPSPADWTHLTFAGHLDEQRLLRGAGELVASSNPNATLARFEEFELELPAALSRRLQFSSDLFFGSRGEPAGLTVRAEASGTGLHFAASAKQQDLSRLLPMLGQIGLPIGDLDLSGHGKFDLALQADTLDSGALDWAGGRGTLALDFEQVRWRGQSLGRAQSEIRLAGNRLEVGRASIQGLEGSLEIRDLVWALGAPRVTPLTGSVSLHGPGPAQLLASGAGLSFGPLDQVDLELRFDERRADLEQFDARGAFGHVGFKPSATEFAGGVPLDFRGVGALDTRHLIQTLQSIRPLAGMLPPQVPVREVAFDIALSGTLADPRARLQLHAPEGAGAEFKAEVQLAKHALELVSLSFAQPGARAKLSGLLSAPPAGAEPATRGMRLAPAASWRLSKLAGQAEWTRPHPLSGALASGRFEFDLHGPGVDGESPSTLAFEGSANWQEAGLVSLRTPAPGSSLEGSFASCSGPRFQAEVDLKDPLERFVRSPLGASFGELQLPLSRLVLSSPTGEQLLRSNGPILVQLSPRHSWLLPPVSLHGPLGYLLIEAGSKSGSPPVGIVHATEVDLGLLESLVPGQLPRLQGLLESLLWTRELTSEGPAESFELQASELDLGRAGLAARLDLRGESAPGSGRYQLIDFALREPRAGSLVFERAPRIGTQPATWTGALDLGIEATLIDRWSSSDDDRWQALAASWVGATADAQLRIGELVELQGGKVDLPGRGLHLALAGSMGIPQVRLAKSTSALPARWRDWLDAWLEAPIEIAAEGQCDDLGTLTSVLPDLRSASGRAQFSDIELRGTLRSPRGSGALSVKDASLKFEGTLPALDELSLEAKLTGDTLSVTDLTGRLASAPIRANASVTFPEHGEPLLHVVLEGQDVLLARSRDLRLRGDVDLLLSGPPSDPRLEGEIQLQRSRYARSLPVLSLGLDALRRPFQGTVRERGFVPFSVRTAPWDNIRFDVRVTAQEPLRLENNLYQGGLVPDLRLAGTSRQPELIGRVFLEPGVVALPATKLRIAGGTVRFDATDPFVPQLDVYGESRVRGHDLAISITGPYDDPSVRVSSVPPLPPGDALVLLTTGQLTEQALSEEGSAQTARLLAVYLVQDLGASLFGGSEGSSALDRLEVVKGQEIAPDGTETFEASWRINQNVLLQGDQLRLVGEYDRFQEVNFGLRFLWRFR